MTLSIFCFFFFKICVFSKKFLLFRKTTAFCNSQTLTSSTFTYIFLNNSFFPERVHFKHFTIHHFMFFSVLFFSEHIFFLNVGTYKYKKVVKTHCLTALCCKLITIIISKSFRVKMRLFFNLFYNPRLLRRFLFKFGIMERFLLFSNQYSIYLSQNDCLFIP